MHNTKRNTVRRIGATTGVAIVVANMIGTGAFTSLGFQVAELQSPLLILSLWVLGGILALAGAFSFVETGTVIQKSGGEYTFLSELYAPFMGYLAGWVSLTVGFAAPVALSALAVIAYFPYLSIDPVWGSISLIAVISLIHSFSLQSSALFQNVSTLLKLLFVLVLIGVELAQPAAFEVSLLADYDTREFFSSAFVIALIYVSYSYSGWNAAVYILEEFKDVKKSLSFALIGGTLIVTLLYTLLQYVFLKHIPLSELSGKIDIGAIAATKLLGTHIGNYFSLGISLLLISSVSAMVWVGPRVTASMARDHKMWRIFGNETDQIPIKAIWLQFSITALLLITGTFEQILIYCGFLLTLSSMLTVMGIFVLRIRHRFLYRSLDVLKSPLFPLMQIIYILFAAAILVFAFIERPYEALLGSTNLLLGSALWYANRLRSLKHYKQL